jgi:hypothetical protein
LGSGKPTRQALLNRSQRAADTVYRRQGRGKQSSADRTTFRPWPHTPPEIQVEQLTAVTEQPVVVQSQDDGDSARGTLPDDARAEAREVMDMCNIGPHLIQQCPSYLINCLVAVGLFERTHPPKCLID